MLFTLHGERGQSFSHISRDWEGNPWQIFLPDILAACFYHF